MLNFILLLVRGAAIVVVWVQTLVYVASLFGHLLTVVIVRCALLHGSA